MREIDCLSSTRCATEQFDSISFSDIPGQSRLFLQYLTDPQSLKKYYPSAVNGPAAIAERASEVLGAYQTDRSVLCDILIEQNLKLSAGERTFANLELLRKPGTVAVITGQQAGLFTGPLYTIYKALSAIGMSEDLRSAGIDAVPVFWMATEDHDFEEVASAFILGPNGDEVEFKIPAPESGTGTPVGSIVIPDSFARELQGGLEFLQGNFAPELRERLSAVWKPGITIGTAFGSHLQALLHDYGLIVVDPLDVRLKELVKPVYVDAAEKSNEIVEALVARSTMLESDGYHAQVLVSADYFPLFVHTEDRVRRAIRFREGAFRVADTRLSFNRSELIAAVARTPENFSPGVMLRPVVQDYVFPTLCYFGGGAEIAYFAQNSDVYQILNRPVTPIMHRQSVTIVEHRQAKVLRKYQLQLMDLSAGYETVITRIVDRFLNPSTTRLFADVEEKINTELNQLDQELSRLDPTLAGNLATRRRKILYHIEALQKKFRRVRVERDEIVDRQLRSLFATLLPGGQLQERRINVENFVLRYGPSFIETIYDSLDLDDRGHRVLYLS